MCSLLSLSRPVINQVAGVLSITRLTIRGVSADIVPSKESVLQMGLMGPSAAENLFPSPSCLPLRPTSSCWVLVFLELIAAGALVSLLNLSGNAGGFGGALEDGLGGVGHGGPGTQH